MEKANIDVSQSFVSSSLKEELEKQVTIKINKDEDSSKTVTVKPEDLGRVLRSMELEGSIYGPDAVFTTKNETPGEIGLRITIPLKDIGKIMQAVFLSNAD